jgi:hypothetical protein
MPQETQDWTFSIVEHGFQMPHVTFDTSAPRETDASTESTILCVHLALCPSDQIQSQLGIGRTRISRAIRLFLEPIRHFPGLNNDFPTLTRILEHGCKFQPIPFFSRT